MIHAYFYAVGGTRSVHGIADATFSKNCILCRRMTTKVEVVFKIKKSGNLSGGEYHRNMRACVHTRMRVSASIWLICVM